MDRLHYSTPFCSINSAGCVYTEKIQQVYFKNPEDALKKEKLDTSCTTLAAFIKSQEEE